MQIFFKKIVKLLELKLKKIRKVILPLCIVL